MDLSRLLGLIETQPRFQELASLVKGHGKGRVSAAPASWPYLVAALHKLSPQPAVVVTARPEEARRFYEQLLPWRPGATVLHYPEPEALPYERLTPDVATAQARMKVLSCLVEAHSNQSNGAQHGDRLEARPTGGTASSQPQTPPGEPAARSYEKNDRGRAIAPSGGEAAPRGYKPETANGGRTGSVPSPTGRDACATGGSPQPTTGRDAGATGGNGLIVVCSINAVAQKTIPRKGFVASSMTIRQGQSIDINSLIGRWDAMGYEAGPTVDSAGAFSRRGGILDIYPYGYTWPVRLELMGNQIDSLRYFDPVTQRSLELIHEFLVEPALEMWLPRDLEEVLAQWRASLQLDKCNETMKKVFAEEVEMLRNRQKFAGMAFYAPLFNTDTLLDYLPHGTLVVAEDLSRLAAAMEELDQEAAKIRQSEVEQGDLPPGFPMPHLPWEELKHKLHARTPLVELSTAGFMESPHPDPLPLRGRGEQDAALPHSGPGEENGRGRAVSAPGGEPPARSYASEPPIGVSSHAPLQAEQAPETAHPHHNHSLYHFDFSIAPSYSAQIQNFVRDVSRLKEEGRHIMIISNQAPRLSGLLGGYEIVAPVAPDLKELPAAGQVALVQGLLDGGWAFKDASNQDHILFTDREIFGFIKQRKGETRKQTAKRLIYLSELEPGDFVVHADHGVARFGGTRRMTADGNEREYLILEYAGEDKLYVPVEQIDRITRYIGASDLAPSISKLGTQEWRRTRQKTNEAVEKIAKELLEIYATRETKRGYAFSPDTVWQQELEASFPYVETSDQLEAIRRVKEDMESPKPMDRLICGEVGYGKTEVALRAAFKCVMEGRQVAILVPTTILAHQHYHTFCERMKPFPIKIGELSRFSSDKEQQAIVEALADGKMDICIGTHKLIQPNVKFKNLGLVVIDEEQRFGVMHKEYFKKMRHEVDVLTLTATPIPRTLHMALVDVRDMSLIETPPEERLPIKTMVGEYNDRVVRESVLKELARDGQVFYVHNRVQGISALTERIRRIVPEAKLAVGHGQLPEETLENVMLDFSHKKTNLLVCTTIIESGLDMPNVNTLIVEDADKLGLTQLYQLRGRVGRSATRAYAYFLYPKDRRLTIEAEKRLQAIFEASELGAGFHLAMKDLEIRGAGNLLGTEQSGQITAVGFELYTQLLSEAVEKLKAAAKEGKTPAEVSARPKPPLPPVELPLNAFIPITYVSDMGTRLDLYQRMSRVTAESEIEEISSEMVDRFGKLPAPARNLLYVLKIRLLARDANITTIVRENEHIILKPDSMKRWTDKPLKGHYEDLKPVYEGLSLPLAADSSWQQTLEKLLKELAAMGA